MPSKTFNNLPEDKKTVFLEACFEEFAVNGYESASLNRIVKKARIAKGSIYQYFENKRDLYLFLIDYSSKMRLDKVDDLIHDPDMDFFELLVINFAQKIDFDLQNPLISGFQYSIIQEINNPELGNMLLNSKMEIMRMVKDIVKKYQAKGQLRSDLNIDIIAYQIVQVQLGIYDYLAIKYNIDFISNIKNKKPVFSISKQEIVEIVRDFSKLLKTGMKK